MESYERENALGSLAVRRESGAGRESRRRCKGPEEHVLFQKADPGVEKEGPGFKG